MGKDENANLFSFLDPDFLILAHRGAGAARPENTVESWEHTWSSSPYLIPECDVSTTSDGVPVGFHDDDFSRVGRPPLDAAVAGKKIGEITWAQARRVDVGAYRGPGFAGQCVPRVADGFERMRGRTERRMFVDYKHVSLPGLAEMVQAFGIERQIVFAASDQSLLRQWKELSAEAKTMLWVWNSGLESVVQGVEAARQSGFAGIDGIQLHVEYRKEGEFIPSAEFIRELREELKGLGKALQVFPSHREYGGRCPIAAIDQLLDLGVNSFATDYPEDALAAIASWY